MIRSKHSYSKKTANKNIKALASCSEELLQALVDVMFKLAPDNHEYLKVLFLPYYSKKKKKKKKIVQR